MTLDPLTLAPGWQISPVGQAQSDGIHPYRTARLPITLSGPGEGLVGLSGHLWLDHCPAVTIAAGDRTVVLRGRQDTYPEFGLTARTREVQLLPGPGCAAHQQVFVYNLTVRQIRLPIPSVLVTAASGFICVMILVICWRYLLRQNLR